MQDIANNIDLQWNWDWVSMNPNVTMEFIMNNKKLIPFKNWSMAELSRNKGITMQDICNYPKLHWVYENISENHGQWVNLTSDAILEWENSLKDAESGNKNIWEINQKNITN